MTSSIQRVVAELTAALAEIEDAQIALANAQARSAQALMGFSQAAEGSNHELTKETRAYWAGASNKFDRARSLLESAAQAIGTYQHDIAPGLARSRTVSAPPTGGELVKEAGGRAIGRGRGRGRAANFMNVSFRKTDAVVDEVAKPLSKLADQGRLILKRQPSPPTSTTTANTVKIDNPPQEQVSAPDLVGSIAAIMMIGVGIATRARQGRERLKERGRRED